MSLFQSHRQPFRAEGNHAAGVCPLCEQPIASDVARRIEAKRQEQHQAVLRQARAEALAAARTEAKLEADTASAARLAQFQEQLAKSEQARSAIQHQLAEMEKAKEVAVQKLVAEKEEMLQRQSEDLQRRSEAAILTEKAKVLKLQSELADMQRKLEGKSAHELGEGSEIDLFEELRAAFEGDRIERVPKGVNGADVIHDVVHRGKVCGRIVYDAKNRDAWQNGYATKLRADKLAHAADHAILSSNKFPKGCQHIHCQDGVLVVAPALVVTVAAMLRDQVLRMYELRISQDEREHKSEQIYAFITSEHCKQLLDSVEAQTTKMVDLDSKEQEWHRRNWDQRRKLISTVQKAKSDLCFEIDRIVGTAGNGPDTAA
jgi:hypothetical protein